MLLTKWPLFCKLANILGGSHPKFYLQAIKYNQENNYAFSRMCTIDPFFCMIPVHYWRPFGDYCCLSMVNEPDHYLLPNIADVTSNLHRKQIFSKFDLLKGYYQVPINPENIVKTNIITSFRTHTINCSCFGLHNSGATFNP